MKDENNSQIGITVEVRMIANAKKLKATANVCLMTVEGELVLNDYRIIQNLDGKPWVGSPSQSYQKDGKTINRPLVEAGHNLGKRITKAVLDEYQRLIDGENNFHASSKGV